MDESGVLSQVCSVRQVYSHVFGQVYLAMQVYYVKCRRVDVTSQVSRARYPEPGTLKDTQADVFIEVQQVRCPRQVHLESPGGGEAVVWHQRVVGGARDGPPVVFRGGQQVTSPNGRVLVKRRLCGGETKRNKMNKTSSPSKLAYQ
ncbi:hypothetical protein E2C01_064739 [Portunus trituberculatus]|uniref:Uncharacterized protein n=1 Tax=Portunus trituberculatus TaxID=210409 RepID=A0A5B7HL65_PORTR|nr:hypothetical protein [Portunus trituberculatus]